MTAFTDLNLDPRVLQAVTDTGYETPTPIQAEAIPHALNGRDVLGIAQTGTGKTASFTLPMLTLLAKGRARARMPRSLVLAPTRELAAQVAENFETYSRHIKLSMALLIGGTSFKDQDRLIDRGVDVLIATPGRLLDHFERGKLMLTGIEIMVVDEADRMLDMGFIPDIERIFKLTPFTRQTMFYSATMAPEITRITQEFLSNPVRVEVARQATAAETIEQAVCKIAPSRRDRADSEKRAALRALIDAEGPALTNGIIFCNRKRDVDVLAKSLTKHGYDAAPIHGDLDQSIRTRTLDSFRDKSLRLLIASDVAARGLDIPSVSHVFNFDIPIHSEDYIHRIGRTGRAGRSGKALSLYVPADKKHLDKVEELLGKPIPVIDNPLGTSAAAEDTPAEQDERRAAPRSRTRERSRRRDDAAETVEAPVAETRTETRTESRTEYRSSERSGERGADRASDRSGDRGQDRASDRTGDRANDRGSDRSRGRRGRNDTNRVVGMGDHVPAFMTRDLREALADLPGAGGGDDEEPYEDDAVAAEAETATETSEAVETAPEPAAEDKPNKKPRRKKTARKADDAAAETAEAGADTADAGNAAEQAPAPAATPAEAAEAAADEKPKKPRRRRSARKAAEDTAEDTAGDTAPAPDAGSEGDPEADPKSVTETGTPAEASTDAVPAGAQPDAGPAPEAEVAEAEATEAEAPNSGAEVEAPAETAAEPKQPAADAPRQRKPRARASASSVIDTVKAEAELEKKAS
ncbi:DEAD/DEAH box helicase [Rhodobacteraceae bacterium 2CG4]|uniref:DEAD-box ATP-dependent RNA helicase RhpA n=1 Tax=Halovulum marinum TaxID=2662447 RepID=A0A6L5YXK7_9RHOB|nr:DEAD/DEAH box helicase [Halovulum marinum]